MSWRPMVIFPEVGGMKPVTMRMVVDLPAPFGPRKPNTSPRSTVNETSFTASLVPNALVRFSTLIMFPPAVPCDRGERCLYSYSALKYIGTHHFKRLPNANF